MISSVSNSIGETDYTDYAMYCCICFVVKGNKIEKRNVSLFIARK